MEVRAISERYGIPYNTGPLHRQFGTVVRKIVKLALPPQGWVGKQVDKVLPTVLRPALGPLLKRGGPDAAKDIAPPTQAVIAKARPKKLIAA